MPAHVPRTVRASVGGSSAGAVPTPIRAAAPASSRASVLLGATPYRLLPQVDADLGENRKPTVNGVAVCRNGIAAHRDRQAVRWDRWVVTCGRSCAGAAWARAAR